MSEFGGEQKNQNNPACAQRQSVSFQNVGHYRAEKEEEKGLNLINLPLLFKLAYLMRVILN